LSNAYFQFKQFRIDQEDCAMKVCTDACILGAWYASKLLLRDGSAISDFAGVKNILDIGSGTGLLMMMLAQNTKADIHGIEIESGCFQQMEKNINQNDWSSRITGYQGDARNYLFPIQYDFIISNPPFYENDLSPEKESKQLAMHSKALNLEELVAVVVKNLMTSGTAGIMLPFHRSSAFEILAAKKGLFKSEELKVRQTPKHNWFRSITSYSYSLSADSQLADVRVTELTIKDAAGNYTDEFRHLLGPYYLQLPDQEVPS